MKDWNIHKEKIEKWIDKHEILCTLIALLLILTVFFTGYAVGKAKRIKKASAEEITSTYIYAVNLTLPTVWNYVYNTTPEQWYPKENIKLVVGINDNNTSYINLVTENTTITISTQTQYITILFEYNGTQKSINFMARAVMGDDLDKIAKLNRIETWIFQGVTGRPETARYQITIYATTFEEEQTAITIPLTVANNIIYPLGSLSTNINDITILNNQTDIDLSAYWQNAYNEGVKKGKILGIEDGKQIGYANGLQDGLNNAENGDFLALLDAVFYAPLKALFGMLNINFLGFNLYGFFTAIFGLIIMIALIKLIMRYI